jgi:hypothetical protein
MTDHRLTAALVLIFAAFVVLTAAWYVPFAGGSQPVTTGVCVVVGGLMLSPLAALWRRKD